MQDGCNSAVAAAARVLRAAAATAGWCEQESDAGAGDRTQERILGLGGSGNGAVWVAVRGAAGPKRCGGGVMVKSSHIVEGW